MDGFKANIVTDKKANILVIGGMTGSGKTEILHHLKNKKTAKL